MVELTIIPRMLVMVAMANVQYYNYNEKGHYARDFLKPRVRDAKYFREQMLLAMKDEAGSNLNNEENDFMLDTLFDDETIKELTAAVMLMARIQPADGNAETVSSYDAKVVIEVNASSKVHEHLSREKRKTIIQTSDDDQIDSNIIFDDLYMENNSGTSNHDSNDHDKYHEIQMLVYNVQREAENQKRLNIELNNWVGLKNPERLKKAIAAQPKMYDGETLHSTKLVIHSPDSEETLQDAEESRLKMRNKMVQFNYEKLNSLYETFVPQQEPFVQQIYFLVPSTSSNDSVSKEVTLEFPIKTMPKESKLLNMFEKMNSVIYALRARIDKTLLEDSQRSDIQHCVLISVEKQKNEMLQAELEKSSNDPKDIQANLLKRIKILKNDFKLSQAQSIDFKLMLQHQKEKMACDVSLKSKLSTINVENVLLKTQVESVVNERENIKLEYQTLFNSIKETQSQHQKEINELIENVNQKTYAYADVRAQNQDLLMTISELKNKFKTIDKGKNVYTKFDKFETLGTLLCVTSLPKNIAVKAKKVSTSKVNADRSKPVTSHSIPTTEQRQTQNKNVLAIGMYRITNTNTSDSKTNTTVSHSTGVESSNSVRRPKSMDSKSKNRVLKITKAKSSTTHVWKMSSSVSLDSNKNSSVKRALFTTPIATKSKSLDTTSVVVKSRLSFAKTATVTTKVSSVLSLSPDSSQRMTLSNYMNNKIATSRKWQKWFEYKQGFNWSPKGKTVQSQSTVKTSITSVKTKSKTPVTTQKWVAKFPSVSISCNVEIHGNSPLRDDHFAAITGYEDYVQGNLMTCHVYYVECLRHNLFSVRQFCDGDLEVAFRSNTCCVCNLKGDDLLTGSRDSNLYTISISKMAGSSPVCLMSRATSTKSWLWHRRLSHLNFSTINQLTSKDLVNGLPKFKYNKDHLCSACEQGKSKRASLPPKLVPSTESKLELVHMDLCGPIRVASINGKKYILMIVDDYSRYTWVYFLRTKDEAPDTIIEFVNQVQRNLKVQILTIRTDNGTEFKNQKLQTFYAKLGIVHKTSIARMPQQNGVIERQNHTLVEATQTMLIFSKSP
ncbi:retrovirus-related pol polyprotein from transposon TNT 1-94 [Tanacetum coccineum]